MKKYNLLKLFCTLSQGSKFCKRFILESNSFDFGRTIFKISFPQCSPSLNPYIYTQNGAFHTLPLLIPPLVARVTVGFTLLVMCIYIELTTFFLTLNKLFLTWVDLLILSLFNNLSYNCLFALFLFDLPLYMNLFYILNLDSSFPNHLFLDCRWNIRKLKI